MHHTDRKRIVIKLGGSMLQGLSNAFFNKFYQLQKEGNDIVIVHGGGPFINAALKDSEIETTIDNGIRVTCKKSMNVVKHVLLGDVNTSLVYQLNQKRINAIGLNGFDGKLLTCTLLDERKYGFVGEIEEVNKEVLEKLMTVGIIPVLSCLGATACGKTLNINADTVASEVALAIGAQSLLLVTDTPGIQVGNEIQKSASPTMISNWIKEGEIYGGMIPKVKAAIACLDSGIPTIHIVDQQLSGTIIRLEEVIS